MEDDRKPRCMICGSQKDGIDVRPDWVIGALKWLNTHTVKYKNPYRPVVCRDCFQKYRKARRSFERKRIAYLAIGVLFAAVLSAASRLSPYALLASAGVVAFMYLLSLVSYMPDIQLPGDDARRERGASGAGGRRRR